MQLKKKMKLWIDKWKILPTWNWETSGWLWRRWRESNNGSCWRYDVEDEHSCLTLDYYTLLDGFKITISYKFHDIHLIRMICNYMDFYFFDRDLSVSIINHLGVFRSNMIIYAMGYSDSHDFFLFPCVQMTLNHFFIPY